MDDETPRLRALLEELHGELARQSPAGVDDARRAQLLGLQADIQRVLARTEPVPAVTDAATTPEPVSPQEREHLQGRLQETIAGFETAHPKLASALEATMNALSNMGL